MQREHLDLSIKRSVTSAGTCTETRHHNHIALIYDILKVVFVKKSKTGGS